MEWFRRWRRDPGVVDERSTLVHFDSVAEAYLETLNDKELADVEEEESYSPEQSYLDLNSRGDDAAGKVDQSDGEPEISSTRKIGGYMLSFLSAIISTVGMVSVQFLDKSVPHSELNVFRFTLQPFLVIPFLVKNKCDVWMEARYVKWIILVATLTNATNYTWYGATYYLPLGTVSSVGIGLSMLCQWLFGLVILRKLQLNMFTGLLFATAGITLVAQPEFLFGANSNNTSSSSHALRKNCFSFCGNASFSENMALNANTTMAVEENMLANFEVDQNCSYGDYNTVASRDSIDDEGNPNLTHRVDELRLGDGINATEKGTRCAFSAAYTEPPDYTIRGYVMLIIFALCTTIMSYIINQVLHELSIVAFSLWMPMIAAPLSLFVMMMSETPTFPTCWVCGLTLFAHACSVSLYMIVGFCVLQIIHPLEGSIILNSCTTLLNFVLQYTLLSSINPGHRNAAEYTGAALTILGLLAGPVTQICYEQITKRKKK